MKIYTGTGDRGKTSLFSGERISKDNDRIEAYGDVDELNSVLGVLIAMLPKGQSKPYEDLRRIQGHLFTIGAWLATTAGSPAQSMIDGLSDQDIRFLEQAIDELQKNLPELKSFILPGGHLSAASAHVARTVCRRAERRIIRMATGSGDYPQAVLIYLNRLSDYLFVVARHCNLVTGNSDTPWQP